MTTTRVTFSITVACILLGSACGGFTFAAERAEQILDRIGATRGICVVLGDQRCEIALELVKQTELLIYIQLPRGEDVEKARQIVDDAGFYGTRIFIEKGDLTRLHLADNLADALVAGGTAPAEISQAEALRVLRPQGKALLGRKVLTKPFPEGIDDWSHPYHGPDNNPQSQDRVIVAPYLTQFLAEPRYAPLPQVAVASAGRVFKAFGHVAFKVREEPFLNKLVAFDGYNGTILWKRDLAEGVMIHRNTMIATPQILYVGDDKSCKLIDTATGRLKDEIIPPVETAGGTFWKWMALEDGVLYALIGEQEQRDPTKKWGRDKHGWPWDPISEGFNQPEQPWGFGRNVLAIDPQTKKVLWHHREDEPIDSRAMCMKNGRIYIFRFGEYLACLDAKTGNIVWRKTPDNAQELFRSLGTYLNRQDWRTNWRTTCYLKCSDKALYFAGPPIGKLLAVSAEDGGILWENSYSNFQLILREDGLYGISGQIDKHPSVKFAALTGEVLAEIDKARRACTRPTGSVDAIFFRAQDGSVRLDLASRRPQWISAMRPPCHDGVTIANGMLYWWPSVCDCQLTLYGVTCLGPAGDFDFSPQATEEQRLEKYADDLTKVADLPQSPADWPTFRADNIGSAATNVRVPDKTSPLWGFTPESTVPTAAPVPTAPVAAGGLIFVSGPDGIVRALDAATGRQQWKAYTGGSVRLPPTIWKGRALVGSGDGWVYCFEAKTGRLLWRFRATPAERLIPVYGQLLSTWPAASGVLVDDGTALSTVEGTAYVAAGIVNYDGTYVYALDAATGKIKWQNNTSGHLDRQARTGVSVQGHQLLYGGKLYLASGTSISPAVYDARDGKCLNDPAPLASCESSSPRGWELSLLADQVVACGKPFYAHREYEVYDDTVFNKVFLTSVGDRDIVWTSSQYSGKIMCFAHIDRASLPALLALAIGRGTPAERRGLKDQPLWSYDCKDSVAWAVCSNAVLVAAKSQIVALNIEDGSVLWSQPVPAAPVPWGLAVDRDGRVIVTLEDGKILCFGLTRPSSLVAHLSSGRG
ncbi:MAG: PQQ-binding-like beta-propeller repeat protein [Sedimentisphaerales bacterium]|nr:PQQ-binding-like beta-propeller repeat protein [Sedimentisphaerales bacterium]